MIAHMLAAVASMLTLTAVLLGAAQAQEVVRVGHLSITADGPVYIALEKGYFKERGIDVKLEGFTSAAVAMAPLSTGEIHVAGGGINPALFNAFARAFPVRVVAHRTRDVEGNSVDAIMVRSDLKGQVSQVADLRGKRVTINAPAAPGHYLLAKALETAGLALKDVTLVYMPWPDTAAAFATKAIDAAVIVEPFVTQYEDKAIAFTLKRASDVLRNPAWDVAVLFYNDDWAKKNPRTANEFLTAYLKGARDLVEAVGGRNRKEIVDILIKHTRVKDPALYDRMHWGFVDPNGAILRESLRDQQEFYVRQGTVPKAIDIEGMLDERYLKYAIEKLGMHK
jgi:NitT/TauT family transport system substrate-binding protein